MTFGASRNYVRSSRYAWTIKRGLFHAESLWGAVGILAQIGDTGGAYFTSAIAIHSFNTLVLRNKLPGWICLAVNVFGWLIAILFGEYM